jgi:hypothetical protein
MLVEDGHCLAKLVFVCAKFAALLREDAQVKLARLATKLGRALRNSEWQRLHTQPNRQSRRKQLRIDYTHCR